MIKHLFIIKNDMLVQVFRDYVKDGVEQYHVEISEDTYDYGLIHTESRFRSLAEELGYNCSLFNNEFEMI